MTLDGGRTIDATLTRPYSVRMRRADTRGMVKLYRAGFSCAEIAEVYGISRQAVHARLVRAGVTMRDSHGRKR